MEHSDYLKLINKLSEYFGWPIYKESYPYNKLSDSDDLWLGEGGLVGCSNLAQCFCPLLPNPCYKLVRFNSTKLKSKN